jgi:hypothetical protein
MNNSKQTFVSPEDEALRDMLLKLNPAQQREILNVLALGEQDISFIKPKH